MIRPVALNKLADAVEKCKIISTGSFPLFQNPLPFVAVDRCVLGALGPKNWGKVGTVVSVRGKNVDDSALDMRDTRNLERNRPCVRRNAEKWEITLRVGVVVDGYCNSE